MLRYVTARLKPCVHKLVRDYVSAERRIGREKKRPAGPWSRDALFVLAGGEHRRGQHLRIKEDAAAIGVECNLAYAELPHFDQYHVIEFRTKTDAAAFKLAFL